MCKKERARETKGKRSADGQLQTKEERVEKRRKAEREENRRSCCLHQLPVAFRCFIACEKRFLDRFFVAYVCVCVCVFFLLQYSACCFPSLFHILPGRWRVCSRFAVWSKNGCLSGLSSSRVCFFGRYLLFF